MNPRQEWALTHPVSDPRVMTQPENPYRSVDVQRDGNLLVTILAVDR